MQIKQQLAISLGIICIFVIVTGLAGIIYINSVNQKLQVVTDVTSPAVNLLNNMIITVWKSNNILQQVSIAPSEESLVKLKRTFLEYGHDYEISELEAKKLLYDKNMIDDLVAASDEDIKFKNYGVELIEARNKELNSVGIEEKIRFKALRLEIENKIAFQAKTIAEILEKTAEKANAINTEADEESKRFVEIAIITITILSLISITLAVIISLYLSRSIINPVNKLNSAAESIAKGNFDTSVEEAKSSDELMQLTTTFNQMASSLRNMLKESPRLKKFLEIKQSYIEKQSTTLEPKSSYIIKTISKTLGYELMMDSMSLGYSPIVITRTNPSEIKDRYGIPESNIIWLSEIKDRVYTTYSDLDSVLKKVVSSLEKSKYLIFLDRSDYIITKFSFERYLSFINRLNDRIASSSSSMVVAIDPNTISPREVSLLDKELKELKLEKQYGLNEELSKILKFINNQNIMGRQPSFKDIGKEFNITAPTTQKKINELLSLGLLRIIKQGRNKLLEPTRSAQSIIKQE